MKVCKRHSKKDCPTCHTGAYATSVTSPSASPDLYADVVSSFSDSCSSDSSYSSTDSGGGSCD